MADKQKAFENAMKNLPSRVKDRGPNRDTKVGNFVGKVGKTLAEPFRFTGAVAAGAAKGALRAGKAYGKPRPLKVPKFTEEKPLMGSRPALPWKEFLNRGKSPSKGFKGK